MRLQQFLEQNRLTVIERWRDFIFQSYSEEATRFFRGERDRFQNPVGHSIARATEVLYDGVVLEHEASEIPEALETLVRLRAVQELAPSQAVSFAFVLKRAVREALGEAPTVENHRAELVTLETRIDAMAASAFDLYVQCRERIFEIRQGELKRRVASLLRRFGDLEPENSPTGDVREDGHLKGGSEA